MPRLTNGTFIVGSISDVGLSISKEPKEHQTAVIAKREAERLAKSDGSKEFTVFQVVGTVKAVGVIWS
jgi:hypothetical protein